MNNIRRLAIICGGTGGHFYPGLAIARVFQENKNFKACLFIGGHKVGNQACEAKKYGVDVEEVKSAKLSKNPIKFIVFLIKFFQGYLYGKKLLKKFKPDAVLAMGSFTSVPISISAVRTKIPLFLHDGNALIGRANIFLSRWAKLIMTAFDPVNSSSLKCPHIVTGMPIRPEILKCQCSREEAIIKLNHDFGSEFTPELKTVLVFGGSQGAATINKVIPEVLSTLDKGKIQIIHLTGKDDLHRIKKIYTDNSVKNIVLKHCDKMALLYLSADLVICRSGGSTVSELIFFKKPAILIPYPLASDLHQNFNAEIYLKLGLGEIVNNAECNQRTLQHAISAFLNKRFKMNECSLFSESLSNATENIIKLINNRM